LLFVDAIIHKENIKINAVDENMHGERVSRRALLLSWRWLFCIFEMKASN
jgi:hypothetical protein